jgi:hypothetical protein
MGMLEIPGTLRAGSIKMDADATGGGDSIGNSLSQKFSFVDSVPATDGLRGGSPYTYTITGTGHSFYYAKMTLSGKDSRGTHRTAEIEVFNGELQSLFLSNIASSEIEVAVYGDTVKVTTFFREVWFFTNHVEGYSGTLGGGYGKHYGDRAIVSGGNDTPGIDTIEFYSITSGGGATDFGELVGGKNYYHDTYSNGSRVLTTGGFVGSPGGAKTDAIEFITVATKGNSVDFGELTAARQAHQGGDSDGSRGIDPGGGTPIIDTIDYTTIGTLGDSTDFGELSAARNLLSGASNSSRLCMVGGNPPALDTIEFITIGTLGNGIDFGELTKTRSYLGATGDNNRLVCAGGASDDSMEYINIQTLGDGTDYAEQQTGGTSSFQMSSNGSRGTINGGHPARDTINAFTIGILANTVDFGELSGSVFQAGSSSGE